MKKLLFAIAGAASFAALAADPSPRAGDDIDVLGFENFNLQAVGVTGAVVNRDDYGILGLTQWVCTGDDASLVKTYGNDNAAKGSGLSYPAPFEDEGDNYLALDTNGSELQRYFSTDTTNGTPTEVSGPLYIDTLVQFTPSESAPTAADLTGAKLAIWLGVENNVTNLYVQGVQYANAEIDVAVPTAYKITNVIPQPGTWYRLTVKAIPAALSTMGMVSAFTVTIDGTEAVAEQCLLVDDAMDVATGGVGSILTADDLALITANKVFGSMADLTQTGLSCVGFKGTGALDDFVVTTAQPDFTPAALDFTLTLGANVTSAAVTYTVDGGEAQTPTFANGVAQIPAGALVSIAEPVFAAGYQLAGFTTNAVDVASATFPFAFTLDATTVVEITAEQIPVSYPTYVGEDATLKTQYDAWKNTNGADANSAYEKQFLLNVAPGTTVADDALVIESITENATAGWDIVVSTSVSGATLSANDETTYNGYLLVKSANDLAGLASATPAAYPVTAVTGGKVSINVTAGKFMKVVLTTTAPAAANE